MSGFPESEDPESLWPWAKNLVVAETDQEWAGRVGARLDALYAELEQRGFSDGFVLATIQSLIKAGQI